MFLEHNGQNTLIPESIVFLKCDLWIHLRLKSGKVFRGEKVYEAFFYGLS